MEDSVTLTCPICGTEFIRQWPNTKQIACSRKCYLAIYRSVNREKLRQTSADWVKANRSRRLDIQRKWNATHSAQVSKGKYADATREENNRKMLERFHSDVEYHNIVVARGTSTRRLKRYTAPKLCAICGSDERLQCHHKDGNPLHTDLTNLQWLCTSCHNLVHSEG